jgi:hypothetical protein
MPAEEPAPEEGEDEGLPEDDGEAPDGEGDDTQPKEEL